MKKMKKILASLMVVVIVLTAAPLTGFIGLNLDFDWIRLDWLNFNAEANAETYSGTCGDNLTWTLDTETGELVISGEGEMSDAAHPVYVPWYPYRESIRKITIGKGVTSVGSYTMHGCFYVESVIIPDSITYISDKNDFYSKMSFELIKDSYAETYSKENNIPYYYAYNGTEEKIISVQVISRLSFEINKETYTMTINCSGNMPSFSNEDAPWVPYKPYIKHVKINNGCTNISANAFKNFKGLKSVSIPDSVTGIGNSAFYQCIWLENITIGSGVTSIGNSAFYNCDSLANIIIPNGVTSIGEYAFYESASLHSITIPDSVTSIGKYAFYKCGSLTEVKIGNGVTSIQKDTFAFCESLATVILGNGVKNIDECAFGFCSSLTSVTLCYGLAIIGEWAFRECENLPSITIPDSVKRVDHAAFYRCKSLTEITMPISAHIYSYPYTFGECDNIEKVTLTKGDGTVRNYGTDGQNLYPVNTYYGYTPWHKSSCKTVIIEDGITAIGDYMFYDCTGIETISIPESVKMIGKNAFVGCKNLKQLIVFNRHCTFEVECTSYYTTICGFAGSTAEAYANEMGLDFEPLEDDFSDILKIFIKIVDVIRSIISKPFHRYMFEQM